VSYLMTPSPIPLWTSAGLIPPIDTTRPTSRERSPYFVSLSDFVLRFGTSADRRRILDGFLRYRARLHAAGLVKGFQWLDGSFLENVERIESRPPKDLDVVRYYRLPPGLTRAGLRGRAPDAVAKVGAGLAGRLSAAGPVPNRDESQLLITSTALGSFGFELEEYHPGMLDFGEDSPVGRALELRCGLLESTLGTDDDLADSAAGVEPRAVAAVRNFLEMVASNEAVCALEYGERLVCFRDVGEVRRAVQRLSQDNLREEEATLSGEFQGVLPEGRRFEFRRVEEGEVVRGKIGSAVGDPAVINRHLHQTVQIRVLETRVGNGKPRYTLLALPTWPSET
jgi:hypothetical protein